MKSDFILIVMEICIALVQINFEGYANMSQHGNPKEQCINIDDELEEILESEFPASSKGKKKGASKRGNPLKCATKIKKVHK
jgi:hypothetical protein